MWLLRLHQLRTTDLIDVTAIQMDIDVMRAAGSEVHQMENIGVSDRRPHAVTPTFCYFLSQLTFIQMFAWKEGQCGSSWRKPCWQIFPTVLAPK